ncbi:hypothetical protein B0O41_3959 [Propionibacteriaceae bacterium ES.041]|nr:hypothetical protein B0O41_3959 [Propionibacteriaceae bacterium ES.041]
MARPPAWANAASAASSVGVEPGDRVAEVDRPVADCEARGEGEEPPFAAAEVAGRGHGSLPVEVPPSALIATDPRTVQQPATDRSDEQFDGRFQGQVAARPLAEGSGAVVEVVRGHH